MNQIRILVLCFISFGSAMSQASQGAPLTSMPFFYEVGGTVCVNSICKAYSASSGQTQVQLTDFLSKSGQVEGEGRFSYNIEGIDIIGTIHFYQFGSGANAQTAIQIKSQLPNSAEVGSSEVNLAPGEKLNYFANFSAPIILANGKTITPHVVVGPSFDQINFNLQRLIR